MDFTRRRLALGLGSFSLLGAPSIARAQSPLTFLFVEADDCEPCKRWHSTEGYWWKNAPEYSRVNTVFLRARSVRNAYGDSFWPQYFRRFRDVPGTVRATPGYFVIRDDKLVLNAAGLNAWRRQVYPALREMVAIRDGHYRAG
jgi:hypothetical protein